MTQQRDYSRDYNLTTPRSQSGASVVTPFIERGDRMNGPTPDYGSQAPCCSQGVVKPKWLISFAATDLRLLTTLIFHKENKREKTEPRKVYAGAMVESSHA